jgi:hypothetical protein
MLCSKGEGSLDVYSVMGGDGNYVKPIMMQRIACGGASAALEGRVVKIGVELVDLMKGSCSTTDKSQQIVGPMIRPSPSLVVLPQAYLDSPYDRRPFRIQSLCVLLV